MHIEIFGLWAKKVSFYSISVKFGLEAFWAYANKALMGQGLNGATHKVSQHNLCCLDLSLRPQDLVLFKGTFP